MRLLSTVITSICITITASAVEVKNWAYQDVTYKNTKAASYSTQTSVDDDSLNIKYFKYDKKYTIWFEFNDRQILKAGRAEFFIRTKEVSGNGRGRYSSDYVFEGKVVVQPDNQGRTQFITAQITQNDIEAIKKYSGNDMGVGYFNQDDRWRTYLFSGKNLWPSYTKLVNVVKRQSPSQKTQHSANDNRPRNAMDVIRGDYNDAESNQMSDEELKKYLNGRSTADAFVDWMEKNPKR